MAAVGTQTLDPGRPDDTLAQCAKLAADSLADPEAPWKKLTGGELIHYQHMLVLVALMFKADGSNAERCWNFVADYATNVQEYACWAAHNAAQQQEMAEGVGGGREASGHSGGSRVQSSSGSEEYEYEPVLRMPVHTESSLQEFTPPPQQVGGAEHFSADVWAAVVSSGDHAPAPGFGCSGLFGFPGGGNIPPSPAPASPAATSPSGRAEGGCFVNTMPHRLTHLSFLAIREGRHA